MKADSKISAPYLQKLLEEVARREGFDNPRFEATMGSGPGDNFTGTLYRVTITNAQTSQSASVMLKVMPDSVERRMTLQCDVAFLIEVGMYSVVLPAYFQLLRDKGLIAEDAAYPCTPRCLAAQAGSDCAPGEEALVLQDMRSLGFAMCNRRSGVDLDAPHLRVVLRGLAQLHAHSLALQHLHPDTFQRVQENVREKMFVRGSPSAAQYNMLGTSTGEILKMRFPAGSKEFQKAKQFLDHFYEDMCSAVSPDADGGNVICHGDCWTNNLLFKYSEEEPQRPEAVCFLDFQGSRYAPPVTDLLYLLYTCSGRAVRERYAAELLREYHGHLVSTLRMLGCPYRLYTWDRLQCQLKRCGRFGFGMVIIASPFFMADPEHVGDLEAVLLEQAELTEQRIVSLEKSFAAPARVKLIADVLEDMIAMGYL